MISLHWQDYARWLASIQGMDIYDAVDKASTAYQRQYKKQLSEDEIQSFWDEYWTIRERA